MKNWGVRGFSLLALVLALTVTTSVHAEEKQERNLGAHFGLGVGAAVCSLVYGPVKVIYATLGTVTSGMAWLFTGGRTDIAREIITASGARRLRRDAREPDLQRAVGVHRSSGGAGRRATGGRIRSVAVSGWRR